MKVILNVIGASKNQKKLDQFMHAGDVFEKSKKLGCISSYTIYDNGTPIDIPNLCTNFKVLLESSGNFSEVFFVGINTIDDLKPDKPYFYLIPGIRSISDGEKFFLLKDALTTWGYTPEYDQYLIITGLK